DEPRPALGNHHGSRLAAPAQGADRGHDHGGRDLYQADGRRGRAPPRLHRVERARRPEPGRVAFSSVGAFGAFAWNSKPIFPSGCLTRNALNRRPFFETKAVNRSVLPVASSFFICSRSIGCCRIMRPERKSQLFPGPTAFSQV